MPPKVTINFGRHVCDSTPELCKTVKIKVTYKSESDSFALKTMAGTMTVLLLTLFVIQCLRIERSNGLEISGDNLETNTSNSTHQEFNIKDLNAIEKTGDTAPAFPTPSSALPEMVKKAKEFARHYLSSHDLKRLRVLVQKNRQNGMETDEIRRIVVNFLNSVLNQTAKIEINKQREQLQRDFGSAAILQ